MAHFAKLGIGNIVERVEVVSNDIATTEQAGINFLRELYNEPNGVWKQTSYNTKGGEHLKGGTPFRKNYAGIDYTYDETRDVFIPPKPFESWLLNERFFGFDIFGINEGFQFTNYKAPGDKYGKHVDRSFDFIVRKLSVSIQLTDPKEYNGGELYLYDSDKGTLMDKKQGTLIIFPSYVLHEVMPVTKGERNSLVTWVTGNQFK